MVFLEDKNIDSKIVNGLRIAGYEILYVAKMKSGLGDDQIMNILQGRTGNE